MIDKIISFGDSFMYGSDLSDCDGTEKSQFSQLTWPALCAKELGLEYHSYSGGAFANKNIALNIFHNASPTALNIINWTWVDRFSYLPLGIGKTQLLWKNITPASTDSVSKFYYKHIQSEFDDIATSLMFVYSTLSYLKNEQIPFVSTYLDKLLTDTTFWDTRNAAPFIMKTGIENDLQTFPNNQTFLEWSRSNGYPESKGWHPLEQAHQEAAKIMLPVFKKEISKHTI